MFWHSNYAVKVPKPAQIYKNDPNWAKEQNGNNPITFAPLVGPAQGATKRPSAGAEQESGIPLGRFVAPWAGPTRGAANDLDFRPFYLWLSSFLPFLANSNLCVQCFGCSKMGPIPPDEVKYRFRSSTVQKSSLKLISIAQKKLRKLNLHEIPVKIQQHLRIF